MLLAIKMLTISTRRIKKGLSEEVALELNLKTKRTPGLQTAGRSESQAEGTANSKVLR